jgi:hypothetical protein
MDTRIASPLDIQLVRDQPVALAHPQTPGQNYVGYTATCSHYPDLQGPAATAHDAVATLLDMIEDALPARTYEEAIEGTEHAHLPAHLDDGAESWH